MRQIASRRAALLGSSEAGESPRLAKHLGNVAVFALAAALVYLVGATLIANWPMLSAMVSAAGVGNVLLWMPVPLLLLVTIAWAAVHGSSPGEEKPESAEDILRERCARGEIDAEEYERTLEVLRSRREEV